MWKVVRNELTYLNTRFNVLWYFPTAYLILLCILLCYDKHTDATDQIHLTLIELFITTMILTFLLKLIELTLYEINEKRVKQQALLPLPRWQTGFTRFLIPTILLCLLLVLYTILLRLLLVSELFLVTVEELLIFPSVLIILTYCLRLYSEASGRFLFALPVVYIVIGPFLLPIDSPIHTHMFSFFEYASTISGAIQISAFISIYLWVSFMLRKSYLK